MVNKQAVSASQIYSSYDAMQPMERRTLQNQVYNAKQYNSNIDQALLSSLTPEFAEAVNKEIAEYKAEKIRIEAIAKERARIRNTEEWDRGQSQGKAWINQQPTERYSDKTIGKQGYKWLQNFKGKNGLWYARYQPVRGGTNFRYYTISTEEWDQHWPIRVQCPNGHTFSTMTPVHVDNKINTTCPECGSTEVRR